MALILVRQVLIIIENLTLTTGLEQEVAARTAELEGLGAIVNSSTDAILSTTPDGIITSWNPGRSSSTATRLRRRWAAMRASSCRRAAPRGDEVFEQLRDSGEAMSFETEHLRKDGAVIPVSVTISPIREAGTPRDRRHRPGTSPCAGPRKGTAGGPGSGPGIQPAQVRVPGHHEP